MKKSPINYSDILDLANKNIKTLQFNQQLELLFVKNKIILLKQELSKQSRPPTKSAQQAERSFVEDGVIEIDQQ